MTAGSPRLRCSSRRSAFSAMAIANDGICAVGNAPPPTLATLGRLHYSILGRAELLPRHGRVTRSVWLHSVSIATGMFPNACCESR
jgi:hypothetical protein